jgi:hypothetical protein
MLTEARRRTLRVFISSPGDVADERSLARQLLKQELPYDPLIRGYLTFDVVSYDDPSAPLPVPASTTPQEAVNRFGLKPSECDIVIIILWSRIGTPLDHKVFSKMDGNQFLSGTEWEFEDAYNAQPRPTILVYRRSEEPKIGLDDPAWDDKKRQYDLLRKFFEQFNNVDSSVKSGFKTYLSPHEFKRQLETDLKYLIRHNNYGSPDAANQILKAEWSRSPYPGLRAFKADETSVFLGGIARSTRFFPDYVIPTIAFSSYWGPPVLASRR